MARHVSIASMHRTRIKICGVTRPDDALVAANAGADAIGIVFHPPSRRHVALDQARAIIGALPAFVTAVGLFVDEPAASILQTSQKLGLSTVQLHGNESPQKVAELLIEGLKVIKAIRVTASLSEEMSRWIDHPPTAFVLETAGTTVAGGSGIPNDFQQIRDALDAGIFEGASPLIVAGGLTPDNVARVIRLLNPWAVDVSTGVEDGIQGVKSHQKIRDFIQAVHQVTEEMRS